MLGTLHKYASGSMLSRKTFENLHSMMAILVLLEQVLRQIVFEFFALNFEVFKYRYDAIFPHVFDFCVGHRYKAWELLLSKRFEIMKKLYSSKALLKKVPHP